MHVPLAECHSQRLLEETTLIVWVPVHWSGKCVPLCSLPTALHVPRLLSSTAEPLIDHLHTILHGQLQFSVTPVAWLVHVWLMQDNGPVIVFSAWPLAIMKLTLAAGVFIHIWMVWKVKGGEGGLNNNGPVLLCGVPNPLWHMLGSVHWPNREDAGTPFKRAQESASVREYSPVSGGRACSPPNAWHQPDRSRSGRLPPLYIYVLPPNMCIGGLAHPLGAPGNQQGWGPPVSSLQPLDLPGTATCGLTAASIPH